MEMIKLETKLQNNVHVLVSVCHVSNHLHNILKRCREQDETLIAIKNMADMLGMTVEDCANEIEIIGGYPEFSYELLEKLSDLYDESFILPKESISNLKKRIKYCKNPMERKKLQQELNSLYKERNKR